MAELPCDVASTSLDDSINPKTTPCASRTAVIPDAKAIAAPLPAVDCSSRIVTTICTGTNALPMINGASVLHMVTILPRLVVVIRVRHPPTTLGADG
jgi:hypothetical protein